MKVCTKNSRSLEDYLYLTGWIFLLTGSIGIYLYLHIVLPNLQGYTCMVYRLFGFYCPGCGGTRAVSALLAGHPLSATWYHPLVTYTVVIFGGFMLTQTLDRLHIGNFILKNIWLLGFHISL